MTKLMKYFVLVSIAILLFSCNRTDTSAKILSVTIEPQRYFAEQLVDSLFEVRTVVPTGTSPETYDPSPAAMAELSKSAGYLTIGYIGFEEQWLDKIRQNNPQLPIYDTSEGVNFIETGTVDDGHDHEHAEGHDHAHHHGPVDPHTWSSPKQAKIIANNMYWALIKIDPANEYIYRSNLEKLEAEIAATDSLLTDIFAKSTSKSYIIYHPALTYLARDYGLTQYCMETDGKEPSPAQMQYLSKTAKESEVKVVFIQEEFDKKNAETIAKETGAKLVTIDPLSYNWSEELIRIAKAIAHE